MISLIILALIGASAADYRTYHTFTGDVLTDDEIEVYVEAGNSNLCTITVDDCVENEGRRLGSSCNNLQYPTKGAAYSPSRRVLPAAFSEGYEPRKAKSGNDLPLSRYIRTHLLSEGRISDPYFTHLASSLMLFMAVDISFPEDVTNYVVTRPYCCAEKGKTDYFCVPNAIPNDDPVHRFSGERCINMTRPLSYQNTGCIENSTTPERINVATPLLDLSTLYGNLENRSLTKGRLFEGGLLKYEEEDGKIWPPSHASNPKSVCIGNEIELGETRCHDTPDTVTNNLLPTNMFAIWFWRHHNFIANELAEINPCWDDETLFATARDINTAFALQVYYYELLPAMMGRENMVNRGAISSSNSFRDIYDETVLPSMSVEYVYALRWIHTIQEGMLRMYDTEGNYLKQFPVVNLTFRTGYLGVDDNIDHLTQSFIRQGCAKFDKTVDPDIAEMGLGGFQRTIDLTTNDNQKSRYFGLQPYVAYREFCFGDNITSFEDLEGIVDNESIAQLQNVYEDVEDIDLMAGMWMETPIEGGHVPPTFFCLISDQLKYNVISDRHWYEREERPYAFTDLQLEEIRKASVARLLCNVGDGITTIQPNAFLRAKSDNLMVSCDNIVSLNLNAWEDTTYCA